MLEGVGATVALGLLIGAALGALMTRGKVCFNAALRRAAFEREPTVLRIFAIAVLQLLLLPVLALLGVSLAPVGLFPVAQILGGLVFGPGMALAGGCITRILWKTGAGVDRDRDRDLAIGEQLLIRGQGGRRRLRSTAPPRARRARRSTTRSGFRTSRSLAPSALYARTAASPQPCRHGSRARPRGAERAGLARRSPRVHPRSPELLSLV